MATIRIQLYLLKNLLALYSFVTHHLCGTLDSLFSKLQTACFKVYQPPSHKMPASVTLMIWCDTWWQVYCNITEKKTGLSYWHIQLYPELETFFSTVKIMFIKEKWSSPLQKHYRSHPRNKSIQRAKQRKYSSNILTASLQKKYLPNKTLPPCRLATYTSYCSSVVVHFYPKFEFYSFCFELIIIKFIFPYPKTKGSKIYTKVIIK